MEAIPASVVIVSRDRPDLLRRCLLSIAQLDYPRFEVVMVACPAGTQVAQQIGMPVAKRLVTFDTANISIARNLGLAETAGDVIAFLDDDAVAEPTWLTHLLTAFEDQNVAQAGGTTLGRNGISVQHSAALTNRAGVSQSYPIEGSDPTEIRAHANAFPRLHGTNMAIRRAALAAIGGFDPLFRFYLDETDATLRIAQSGGLTMHVPKAVVHHFSGPSSMRRADRVPLSVFEIAASAAVFHRKHCPVEDRQAAKAAFMAERKQWLVQHMNLGTLMPNDALRLIQQLTDGYAEGAARTPVDPMPIPDASHTITQRDHRPEHVYLVARPGNRKATITRARDMVQAGSQVTVFDYDMTARYHQVRFTDDGVWLHTGGIFGKERRSEPLFQQSSRAKRVRSTLQRLHGIRSKPALVEAT